MGAVKASRVINNFAETVRDAARKIDVSPAAALLPAAMIILGEWLLLALTAAAVLAHEAGHYIALRLSRGEVTRVKIGVLGASIQYGGNISYGGEIVIACAGPLANAALVLAAAAAGRLTGCVPLYWLAGLSLALCAFNLLPAYPLDGGRAVYNACAYLFGLDAAERIAVILRCAVSLCLAAAGLWLFLRPPHNPTLLICAALIALKRE